jgi:murein endopeptidase
MLPNQVARVLALLALLAGFAAAAWAVETRPLGTSGEEPREGKGASRAPSSIAEPARAQLPAEPDGRQRRDERRPVHSAIQWRDSVAVGLPEAGRLVRGVRFPREGAHYFTWDPIRRQSPNRTWRRWGTDRLVRTVLEVLRDFARAHPNAPRIGVGDLSRPRGGDFGPAYGLPGHSTHQNGLDADIYYPRHDKRERPPESVDQVEPDLAQDLVDRFVAAGAERVLVGPSTNLTGPAEVVVPLVNHDNHLHVRLPAG